MPDVRLIDANALKKEMVEVEIVTPPHNHHCSELVVFGYDIDDAPTIDAVPVEYGQWVKPQGMMPPEYHHRKCCSVCGGWALYDRIGREWTSKYCPHCGAKMDGGAE